MQICKIVTSTGCFVLLAAGLAWAASLDNADKQFLITAARTDMTEAHEGQMAEGQATRTDVKTLGKTLAEDHSASYAQVSQIAAKEGVTIPKGINVSQNHTIVQLVHLKGDNFDRQFAKDEVAAHRQLLVVFQREAKQGKDPEVKAYASKMIPTLEKHLQLAEQCEKPVGRS
jgi:putative membrane protein